MPVRSANSVSALHHYFLHFVHQRLVREWLTNDHATSKTADGAKRRNKDPSE
jgi:hypothetical protein